MKTVSLLAALIVLSMLSSCAAPAMFLQSDEAKLRRDGADYMMNLVTKCGEDFYLNFRVLFGVRNVDLDVWQGKTLKLDLGPGYVGPKTQTEADKLNGVGPTPAGWNGKAELILAPSRWGRQTVNGKKIDRWVDDQRLGVMLTFANGKWSTNTMGIEPIDCAIASALFEP